MALNRCVVFSHSLHHYRRPLRLRNPSSSLSSSALRSTSSSMEAPPEGYRRNVGICLINSSKKVILETSFSLFLHLSASLQVFIRDVASKSVCADFCCLKVGYTRCLANASGNSMICLLLRYDCCRFVFLFGSSSSMFLSSEL